MIKGLKKFTVPYEGTYFDGGKIFGQSVVFAESKEEAANKVQQTFQNDDEPIRRIGLVRKWKYGEKSDFEIYPYWGI